uniref:Uncharacterized protein n=1 Tax=Marseillevirus LCMAC101 TaxID=2506602 RepID=A0A481YRT5_9VIRU|nr:MAG: hypothetical protein LCMAC101_02320 [Marseillevirus LCMAC101]
MSIYGQSFKGKQNYVQYDNKAEVEALNLNVYDGNRAVVFPRHIYAGYVIPYPDYLCSRPRDTEIQYIIGVEREKHPDHFSRFGYARAPYGYGSGHWPGKYNETWWCGDSDNNPKNMAPSRFYEPEYQQSVV